MLDNVIEQTVREIKPLNTLEGMSDIFTIEIPIDVTDTQGGETINRP